MSVGTLLLIVVVLTVDLFSLGTLVKRIINEKKIKKLIKEYKHTKHLSNKIIYKEELKDWFNCYIITLID